jgi:hypothetical protein
MASKFCQHCGSKILAEAKFCAACGQAQAQVASTATSTEPALTPSASYAIPSSKPSNKKGLIFGAGAALVAVALAVVFLVIKPFGSASLNGQPASAILSQLMADGFCPVPDTRSGFTDYPTLLSFYDADTLRGCTDSKNGNYFFLYTNMSPSDLDDELESSSSTQNVFGADWVIKFVGSDNGTVLAEIAQKYGATID